MTKNIYIYFPDRNIGGGPFWLMRLAIELSKDPKYKVFYIDYKDGYSHKIEEFKNVSNITFIDHEDRSLKLILKEEGILFAPIYYMLNLPHINVRSRVLFHNWHNECLPCLVRDMQFVHSQFIFFMSKIFANNAQVFLDGSHYYANNHLTGIDFPPSFVPMIVKDKGIRVKSSFVKNNEINIAILGRLVLDKIFAVLNVIKLVEKYDTKKLINIHIIGDGEEKVKIPNVVKNNINVIMKGIIPNEKLPFYLSENVDILFAMGTSVLEGAIISLPSVVIPSEIKAFDCDNFLFISETKDFLTGFYPNQLDSFKVKTRSLKEVLDLIYKQKKKQSIGKACLDYVLKFHCAKFCSDLLKRAIDKTTLTFNDILPYYEKTYVDYALSDFRSKNDNGQLLNTLKKMVDGLHDAFKQLPNDTISEDYRYVYQIGTKLSFDSQFTAKDYVKSGLSYPENGFTWSNDHVVSFRFIFKHRIEKGILIELKQFPFNEKQTINVIVNSNYVCQYVVDHSHSDYQFFIDSSIIYNDEINLKFIIPNAVSPSSICDSDDIRILGVAFIEMTIKDNLQN